MAGPYLTPGVYVEEVDSGPRPIQGVATAVAAMIGFTERAGPPDDPNKLLNKAELVTNWNQYVERFGGYIPDAYLPHAVFGYFNNGGERCYVISVALQDKEKGDVAQTVIPIEGAEGSLQIKTLKFGSESNNFTVAIEEGETTVLAEPEEPASKDEADADAASGPAASGARSKAATSSKKEADPKPQKTFSLVIKQGYEEKERFDSLTLDNRSLRTKVKSNLIEIQLQEAGSASLPEHMPKAGDYPLRGGKYALTKATRQQILGDPTERVGLGGLEALDDVTMVVCPDLMSVYREKDEDSKNAIKAVHTAMLNHCENMKYRFAILDSPANMSPQEVGNWRFKEAMYDSKYGALYYPWIVVDDPLSSNGGMLQIPPSGHIAGLYARTDSGRGVHKAPANEIVRGAIDLAVNVTKGEQAGLNPKGVNCIRAFPGMGIRVWGARTLSSDMAWNYINVRRLFNFVEASIEGGTQWVVFEPNDRKLWAKVRRDISSFLRTQWLAGALFGNSPDEAFYVKCDEELNPREIRDLGQLIVEIGMAPVKPAEFVIFRFSQWAGPNAE